MRSTHVGPATGRATPGRDADLFVADLFGAPDPAVVIAEAVPTDAGAAGVAPARPPAAVVQVVPSVQVVTPAGTPFPRAGWAIHQRDTVFEGALDARGSTGALGRPGAAFDPALPFRIHVEGCVCSIVHGAALLVREPEVEYGGQFVDWTLADDADPQKRDAFWREYALARAPRPRPAPPAPDVFRFLQHDHVMRRPVKLLSRHTRAVFEARPLSLRLGPIVRYVDAQRALVWVELETPGLVRVTYGKAADQSEVPRGVEPASRSRRHGTTVRVGGRHYALVWLEGLEPDTAYQYTLALAPLPPSGALPHSETDFTDRVFPPAEPAWSGAAVEPALRAVSFDRSRWLFFRTAPSRTETLRFAHGSCRKWPADYGRPEPAPADAACPRWQPKPEKVIVPAPDMLAGFATQFLAAKTEWNKWPHFFLHTGDQIYADDVGVAMGAAMARQRFASVVPGPGPTAAGDIAAGAWAGRFGARYAPIEAADPTPAADLGELCRLRPRAVEPRLHDMDFAIGRALLARRQAGSTRRHGPSSDERSAARAAGRPSRHKLRVLNSLLWLVPDEEAQVPRVDRRLGLRARQVYRIVGGPGQREREFHIEHPSAGDIDGVHAADYAEYAALYEQAWTVPGARTLLAHLPSYMIFDDHEVTDDWNADPGWVEIVHSSRDPLRMWPTTMTDALCAYWIYQGWGNLSPAAAAADPRARILERCRREGRDALPELRRLVAERSVATLAPRGQLSGKLEWNFTVPTAPVPFLALDLRTDRDVMRTGRVSEEKMRWLKDALARAQSPVAFVVLPVPYLMPDPMLFAFRHPGFTARLASARSTAAFKRGSDLEHPAGNPVWDQIKRLLADLQASSRLKTLVLLSGDIHFCCNLDGQLPGSGRPPRLLQLISSGLQHAVSDTKRKQLDSAYRGWLNLVSRAQGVDDHRGVRITLGGMRDGAGALRNFLFDTSVALVEAKPIGTGRGVPGGPHVQVTHTHLAWDGKGALNTYTFTHVTRPDGRALMTLKDPGFDHPASPKDYPAAPGGLGVTFEGIESGDEGALQPGEAVSIDGEQAGTAADAARWYTSRRAVLLAQREAFVKEKETPPPALDAAAGVADARAKALAPRGSAPLTDAQVEEMLAWLDTYVEALSHSDRQMEAIAVARFRATEARLEELEGHAERLRPRLRERQRAAFRAGQTSKLKETADSFATLLDSVLVAEEWVREAATRMDDIRYLGTTLRTQKALHGWKQPWHELMYQTTNARVTKLLAVANGLNKVLAAWQLADSALTVLRGGKTASDRASAGVSFAATLASAGGTLLGASGFFSLYNNLYLGPMVKHILGQIDQLKDLVSTRRNRPAMEAGYLDLVSWDIEPGGREMFVYMREVMKARTVGDVKQPPAEVARYFTRQRKAFDAGTPKRRGVEVDYDDFKDKRDWIFAFRDDIWGMLYGAMRVP